MMCCWLVLGDVAVAVVVVVVSPSFFPSRACCLLTLCFLSCRSQWVPFRVLRGLVFTFSFGFLGTRFWGVHGVACFSARKKEKERIHSVRVNVSVWCRMA